MRHFLAPLVLLSLVFGFAQFGPADEKRLNNLVAELLKVDAIANTGNTFTFARSRPGWIFLAAEYEGQGTANIVLDKATSADTVIAHATAGPPREEAMRFVGQGEHQLQVDCADGVRVKSLVVRAIPELIHCGLGFEPAIKSYGKYDLAFLRKDILPNITTLIVPNNIDLPPAVIDDWHRQGKKFVAEVGINGQAQTAAEHYQFWAAFFDKAPFIDGIIVNEFIVNAPSNRPPSTLSPERQKRLDDERERYRMYEQAIRKLHADERYQGKMLYAYVGGSGKTLNQEVIGPTFVHAIVECGYRVALERYIFEVSSEQKSKDVLQLFVDGIADWEAKEPGVKQQMVIAFGLFSMPPGGINKQPNVDYHVWMDQQMNLAANDPQLAGLAGFEWWTTILADEETTRFVGKLYRHYAIEGQTEMLTHDPLFLPHIANADFEKGSEGWTLQAAEPASIEAKSFPRYGRIEGRYMGLGRPADPEHIGDTFLWMKRSEKGPNTFSQTIRNLEPGRLYSLKMFSCDYQDLVKPTKKTLEEAAPFVGRVDLKGVELDTQRSFTEVYPSSPEPPIPVWITYHWKVFRATGTTAELTVSDWARDDAPTGPFGLEQTFNFLELQPYHE
ncbi:MAG: hypothetical protein AB7O59_07855 [Pirellulales bacterium]